MPSVFVEFLPLSDQDALLCIIIIFLSIKSNFAELTLVVIGLLEKSACPGITYFL